MQARNSKLCKDDFDRYIQVLYVKSHHVLGMEPLDYMENDERRHTLLVAGDEDNPFPVEKLNSKAVSTTQQLGLVATNFLLVPLLGLQGGKFPNPIVDYSKHHPSDRGIWYQLTSLLQFNKSYGAGSSCLFPWYCWVLAVRVDRRQYRGHYCFGRCFGAPRIQGASLMAWTTAGDRAPNIMI